MISNSVKSLAFFRDELRLQLREKFGIRSQYSKVQVESALRDVECSKSELQDFAYAIFSGQSQFEPRDRQLKRSVSGGGLCSPVTDTIVASFFYPDADG